MSESTCAVHACVKPAANSAGWCLMHYTRWRRHGDPLHRTRGGREWLYDDDPWNKVFGFRHKVTSTGCWEWTGRRNKAGYGQAQSGTRHVYAHRLSYTIAVAPIPDRMTVDHLCFNTGCIRPSHLRLISQPENAANTRAKLLDICGRGHEYNEANTYIRIRNGYQMRQCKACAWENKNRDAVADWDVCRFCEEPTINGRICDTCRGSKLPSVAPRRITPPVHTPDQQPTSQSPVGQTASR